MKCSIYLFWLFLCALNYEYMCDETNKGGLKTLYEWKQIDYWFPKPEDREVAIQNGEYIPEHVIPIDIDVYYAGNQKSKLFITTPRVMDGIPAALSTVTKLLNNNSQPLLAPYPSWKWHQNLKSCPEDRIVSVFRIQIDKCNRLWVLDNGRIGRNMICQPQILAFDLKTNEVIHRYEIPSSQTICSSVMVTPVVDVTDDTCSRTFVYAADSGAYGIVVHDVEQKTSWRIANKLMYPHPDAGTFDILGVKLEMMDGTVGMSLSPVMPGVDRILYFHSLSSRTQCYVHTSILQNETLFHGNEWAATDKFFEYPKSRQSQIAPEAIDRNGIMYFGLTTETSIACWNTQTEFGVDNIDILEKNVMTLQFPSAVKVVVNSHGFEELWIHSCKFQEYFTGTMNQKNNINYRILAVKLDDFIANSKCMKHIHNDL